MKDLYSSYHRLAKMFSKQSGVELVIRGSGFKTDGNRIVIADIPEELNRKLKDPALAGLVHECLHVEHSKIYRKEDLIKVDKNALVKFSGLHNNIEDIRMLALGKRQYDGMNSLQKTGLTYLREYIISSLKEKRIDPGTLLGVCIQYMESDLDTSFLPKTFMEMAEKTKDIWSNYNWKPNKGGHGQSIEITNKIIERLEMEQESLKEEKEKGGEKSDSEETGEKNGEDDSEGEHADRDRNDDKGDEGGFDGDEDSDSEDEDDKEERNDEGGGNSSGGDGDNGEEIEEETKGDGEEETKGDGEGEDDYGGEEDEGNNEENGQIDEENKEGNEKNKIDGENLEKDLENLLEDSSEKKNKKFGENSLDEGVMKAMEKILEREIQNWQSDADNHIPHPKAVMYDVEERIRDPWETMEEHDIARLESDFSEISSQVDEETKKLKARILPLLLAEKRTSFLFEQEEGVIDDAELYKLLKGDGKIYKQRVMGKKVNTAITILNDVSGSMDGSKIRMLQPTLLVITDTLFSLKIPFEILTFTTTSFPPGKGFSVSHEEGKIYNRFEPLYHVIIKDFNQNHLTTRKYIPLIQSQKNNIDSESILWASRRLAERREPRKILFVLSDGQPAGYVTDYNLLDKDLKENVEKIEKSGIEVVGIGLITSAPKKFYPNFVEVRNINQISIRVYEALAKKLMN